MNALRISPSGKTALRQLRSGNFRSLNTLQNTIAPPCVAAEIQHHTTLIWCSSHRTDIGVKCKKKNTSPRDKVSPKEMSSGRYNLRTNYTGQQRKKAQATVAHFVSTNYTVYVSGLRFSWNKIVFCKKLFWSNFKWMTDLWGVFRFIVTIYTRDRSFCTLSYKKKKHFVDI